MLPRRRPRSTRHRVYSTPTLEELAACAAAPPAECQRERTGPTGPQHRQTAATAIVGHGCRVRVMFYEYTSTADRAKGTREPERTPLQLYSCRYLLALEYSYS